MTVAIVFLLFGVVTLIEATMGSRETSSPRTLLAGIGSGVVLVAASFMVWRNISVGPSIGLGATLALLVVFGLRYAKTRRFIPAGLMLALAVIAAGILFTELFES